MSILPFELPSVLSEIVPELDMSTFPSPYIYVLSSICTLPVPSIVTLPADDPSLETVSELYASKSPSDIDMLPPAMICRLPLPAVISPALMFTSFPARISTLPFWELIKTLSSSSPSRKSLPPRFKVPLWLSMSMSPSAQIEELKTLKSCKDKISTSPTLFLMETSSNVFC